MGGGGKGGGGGVQYVPAPAPVTPTGPTYEELAETQADLKEQTEAARQSYASEMDARRQLSATESTLGGDDDLKLKKPSLLGGTSK